MMFRKLSLPVFMLVASACGGQSEEPSGLTSAVELSSKGLPLEDVSCEVGGRDEETRTYAYDAATRTLTSEKIRIIFNESGRYITRQDPSGAWSHGYTYDERGNVSKFEYKYGDIVGLQNSSNYTLTYDGDRVSQVDSSSGDGARTGKTVFSYEGGKVTRALTHSESGDYKHDSTLTVRYDAQGRVEAAQRDDELVSYAYDADGHLTGTTQDGFNWASVKPDGKPEIEQRWYYDANGYITRYTIDGTTDLDNPVVDGVLDTDRHFSAGCTALLVIGADELFNFPRDPGAY